MAAVRKFATEHHLTVTSENAGRRTMGLAGTVAQMTAAFDVELQHHRYAGGTFRSRVGHVHLPDGLHGMVEAVLGLDTRPAARRKALPLRAPTAANASTSYDPQQVAALYQFPAGTGSGQCVAIIELGGGFSQTDLTNYFNGLNITPPTVTAVSVDGAQNSPGGSADGEVMLDIEVVGAVAPGANMAVYFAPNTDQGFTDAITTAINDTTNNPSVISISWGGPEFHWTDQAMTTMDNALQSAAAMGITVTVASGDNGSSDLEAPEQGAPAQNVDFPASSPYVLACGGTTLLSSGNSISSETVWNNQPGGGATGGGVSTYFALPSWQTGLTVTTTAGETSALAMRGVPDVCGDADPNTGYNVLVNGNPTVVGGTSAVAPLWAALIAVINANNATRAGFVNPLLYANPGALSNITQGDNGYYAASAGWNACTGLGSPVGTQVAGISGI